MHYSFYICLFFAVWFTTVNALKASRGQAVTPANFVIMSASIVGCVYSALELSSK